MRAALGIALFSIGVIPVLASSRSSGSALSRQPDVVVPQNSQTMSLLSAHHNIDPTGAAAHQLAIVDNSALVSEGEGEAFVDQGTQGNGQITLYNVRQGDTLASIAKMFGVTTNTILWSNELPAGKIRVGEELVILPISGVKHTVKTGDTLQSIAKKYKADLSDILSYNNLATDAKLSVGDIVIVPDGEISTPSSSGGSTGKIGKITGVPSYIGYYMRPINGGRKTQGIHGHNGIDLGAPVGTPVMASAAGTVIISKVGGWNGAYGTYVVVSHSNGTQTLYAHLSADTVSVGEQVSQGEVIGAIGMTGRTTGPHLHFEIRGAVNPF